LITNLARILCVGLAVVMTVLARRQLDGTAPPRTVPLMEREPGD